MIKKWFYTFFEDEARRAHGLALLFAIAGFWQMVTGEVVLAAAILVVSEILSIRGNTLENGQKLDKILVKLGTPESEQ